jgi:hypothetical protein
MSDFQNHSKFHAYFSILTKFTAKLDWIPKCLFDDAFGHQFPILGKTLFFWIDLWYFSVVSIFMVWFIFDGVFGDRISMQFFKENYLWRHG